MSKTKTRKIETLLRRLEALVPYVPPRDFGPAAPDVAIHHWTNTLTAQSGPDATYSVGPQGWHTPAPAPSLRTDDLAELVATFLWLVVWSLVAILAIWATREIYAAMGWYLR